MNKTGGTFGIKDERGCFSLSLWRTDLGSSEPFEGSDNFTLVSNRCKEVF